MTTPTERLRSLFRAEKFLLDVVNGKYKKVSEIREEARHRLRHYPSPWEIEQIPTGRAKLFFESDT